MHLGQYVLIAFGNFNPFNPQSGVCARRDLITLPPQHIPRWDALDEAYKVLEVARETGYRALLALNGDRVELVKTVAGMAGGDCVLVGDKPVRMGLCRLELPPARYQDLLGGEYGAAVVSMESMVRPSILAAAGEAVRRGGFLAVVGGPWRSWTPGPREGGRGLYKEYLANAISRARLHAWIDGVSVRSMAMRVSKPPPITGTRGYKPQGNMPKRLLAETATIGQARALNRIAGFLRGRGRSLLVRGNRGRGKSYVVGLALAYAIWRRHAGRVVVVGPTPLSVASLMKGLTRGLKVLGVRARIVEAGNGRVVRVSGPWFRVSYETPEAAEPSPILVIDEAAAVGVARVRRLSWRSGKTIVSTTIHGYEGSGRVFAALIEGQLPKPLAKVALEEPIRYPPGDPLEEWIYETFLLKAEPPSHDDLDPGRAEYRIVKRRELARPGGYIEWIMGILMQAHYRSTPDNLLLLLEGDHEVHVLEVDGVPVAVAETVAEGLRAPREARIAWEKLILYSRSPPTLETLRISRIAVTPSLQGRGLGSILLSRLEEEARGRGLDAVTTIYSRHDVLRFWLKNGYTVIYISPRYNRVTGEKNIAMAKPLTARGAKAVHEASCTMKERLLEAAQSIYRDLAAEKMLEMLQAWHTCTYNECISARQKYRLRLYLQGSLDLEQAIDPVAKVLRKHYMEGRPVGGPGDLLAVARIIQGKPWDEAARIAGLSIEEAPRILDELLSKILPPTLRDNGPSDNPGNIQAASPS